MKLEVSLVMRTEDEVRAGRVAAVAVLSALGEYDAEQAIEEWQRMRGKALSEEEASSGQTPNTTTEKFQFAGRLFSAHRRGPRAAVDHAIKLIAECTTIQGLESNYPEIHDLETTLQNIGRVELADILYAKVADRRKQLAAPDYEHEPVHEGESDGEQLDDA